MLHGQHVSGNNNYYKTAKVMRLSGFFAAISSPKVGLSIAYGLLSLSLQLSRFLARTKPKVWSPCNIQSFLRASLIIFPWHWLRHFLMNKLAAPINQNLRH